MRKYFFQSVTAEGKQITGYVSADSIDEAREKLKAGGLSILTLEEPKETLDGLDEGLKVFEFEAINDQHKAVKGTIESSELYAAYRKLRLEYKFEVNFLVESIAAPKEKERIRAKGLNPELEKRLQIEIKIAQKNESKKGKQHEENVNEIENAVAANEEERQFMVDKIDSVLNEVIPLLEENAEFIDTHKKREIEERINLLMRLKHSNSVAHLKSLAQRLIEQISSDEIFLKDANIPPELKEEMDRRKGEFKAIGSRFDKAISKGLLDLQVKLGTLDTGALKDTVLELKPFEKFTNTFYLTFFFLLLFSSLFLLLSYALTLLGFQAGQFEFFLRSSLLWYVWGLGLVMAASFYFLRFHPKEAWYDGLVVVGCTVLAFVVYTVQFPFLFYWT